MKNQILDIPFKESFKDFLKKDEKILWEGAPSLKVPVASSNKEKDMLIYTALIVGTILILIAVAFYTVLLLGVMVLIVVGGYFIYSKNNQKHHIRYAVTSHQVIFQLPKAWRSGHEFHQVYFDHIHEVKVEIDTEFFDVGNIFLMIKNRQHARFKTRNLRTGTKRFVPTLELIDNPKKVVELIQQGIENVNILP